MFISIDLDAFYCGVEEHLNPRLRGEPFCVVQKHCVATLSYPARALGLKKLDNIYAVRRQFPHLTFVNGEDLSKYKKAGRDLFEWLQAVTGLPAERLGIEELRMDVSPIVDAAVAQLPPLRSIQEWLQDPEFMDEVAAAGTRMDVGGESVEFRNFFFRFDGCTIPPDEHSLARASDLRAYVAGQLAAYLRDRMWLELGYSCSIGVGSSKNYAKMAGACHKPRGVTVLQPASESGFLLASAVRSVPGMGSACRHALECEDGETVRALLERHDARSFAACLTPVVGAAGAGALWGLLNGDDAAGRLLKPFELPLSISVEESYGTPCPRARWKSELEKLCTSLVAQAATDWYDDEQREWRQLAQSCRVSLIFADMGYVRRSKSAKYSWPLYTPPEAIGDGLLPLALALMEQLVERHLGRPRVINVAFVSDAA